MERFFHFFSSRHLLAYLITIIIVLLGSSTLLTIKRDSFPAVEFGELLVTTLYPGASPEDVELKVTNEIEKEIKAVDGIKRFASWSMENVSSIHIVIGPDVDDEDKVIREIREAVTRVTDLPLEVTEAPLVTELGTSIFPMMEVGFAGDLPYKDMREIARRFEKKLENVAGVSRVERFGYQAREIRVELMPDSLNNMKVSLGEVIKAIKGRNVRSTAGSFESYTSEKNIVTLAQFRDPMEVRDAIVRTTFEGPLIRIKDLARVEDGYEEEKIRSRVNGQSAISLVAYKTETADIIRTVDLIKTLIEKEKQYLPETVEILVSDDASTYVRNRFAIVMTNGAIGLALVMMVLAVFLSWRVAFWVALGIPVAILGAIFLLPVFDSFIDSVTMTAMVLVIGIVVDDAIIVSENIYKQFESGKSPVDAAVAGVTGVFKPVFTTILTTFIVFLPLFFMPGVLGKFVYVIPLVISLALFVSLAESALALPAHIAGGLGAKQNKNANALGKRFFLILRRWYQGAIDFSLKRRYALSVSFLAVLTGTLLYAATFMEFVLFPSSTAERFVILVETPIGSSLQATSDKTSEVEKIVASLDSEELESYVSRIGTYGDIGSSTRENNAAVLVSLTPFANRERTADDIVEALRKRTDELKGFERIFYMIDAGGPPVGRPIMVRAVGADDVMRKKLADDVAVFLETVDGAKDIDRDDKPGKMQLELKMRYEELARLGVTVAEVARNVRIAYDGEVVTSVRYGDEDVDFRVIFSEKVRKSVAQLKSLTMPNRDNQLISLHRVADFRIEPGPANFHHYKADRAITIVGDIDKNITTPLSVSQRVREHFDVDRDYPGIRLVVGGEAEESEQSLNELFIIMGMAVVGIYFLLVLLFNSLWHPLVVMAAIPFGIIGVIIGFAAHDEALGFLAMTGIIGLAGVVVNDSLVLVNRINELRAIHPEKTLVDIVANGAMDRLRAVILTTISTVAGLLPLAYGIGGSDPYMSPMALALGWGLLFATPLTLILVPCLYLVGEDIIQKGRHLLGRV